MAPPQPARDPRPPRLAILDDNPFVRTSDGDVVPVAATFHRFAEAVVAAGGLGPADYLVPVRSLEVGAPAPGHRPVDPAWLRVVPTEPFDGIAGYARGTPGLPRRNWPVIRDAVSQADLVWIKAPASNAVLTALACRRAGVPRFTWIAGSVRAVVRGQPASPVRRALAGVVAIGYDSVTRWLERTGPAVRLDAELFTTVVTEAEVDATHVVRSRRGARSPDDPFRIAWAGRMAPEKGLDDLLEAIALLRDRRALRLDLIGDGPARPATEALAQQLGVADTVRWHGYVFDRERYLSTLRQADLFVLPSQAEGLPKVAVEAMASGLPVVATSVGAVPGLLGDGARGRLVRSGDPASLADAIIDLAGDLAERERLAAAALAWAAEHTQEAQAARLIEWLRLNFPRLAWPAIASATRSRDRS